MTVGSRAAALPVGARSAASSTAIRAGLVAVLHAVRARRRRARSCLADVARAVLRDVAARVVRAASANGSTAIGARLEAVHDGVDARRVAVAGGIDDSRACRCVSRGALTADGLGGNEIPEKLIGRRHLGESRPGGRRHREAIARIDPGIEEAGEPRLNPPKHPIRGCRRRRRPLKASVRPRAPGDVRHFARHLGAGAAPRESERESGNRNEPRLAA